MTEAEALDMAAKVVGCGDWGRAQDCCFNDELNAIRAHAATIMENAALKADNEALRALQEGDGELLTIAWMDGAHRSNKAHREQVEALEARVAGLTQERDFHRETADLHADRIAALKAENERLREALKPFARAQHIMASIDGDRVRCVLTYPPEATHTFTLASLDAARAALKEIGHGDR